MTKAELVKALGIDKESFDYALPQDWVDEVAKCLPGQMRGQIVPNFVWLYDEKAEIFGRPCSLSFEGNEILSHILMHPQLYLHAKHYECPPLTLQQAFLLGRVLGLAEGGWQNDALEVVKQDPNFFLRLRNELDLYQAGKLTKIEEGHWGLEPFLRKMASDYKFDLGDRIVKEVSREER